MTKRIFRSIFFVTLGVFLASVVLFMGVLFEYFTGIQRKQLRMQTTLAAQGVENEGMQYFEGLETNDFRITWINNDGAVIYDTDTESDSMENHLEREEIKQALETGEGESSRYSVTLMERSFYCAKKLSDGTVLRLSVAQSTLLTLTLGMLQPIIIIFILALILSLVFASRLSKKIVQPLNEINLDDPLKNDCYDELAPLLGRIKSQQRQIARQSDELKRKQQEFEAVTNGMTEGIVLLNSKNDILSINPSAMNLLGVDSSPVGDNIISVNRTPELQELLAKSDEGKRSEKILELCGGKYQVDASPILSDEKIIGTVLLFLDVTKKEKAEQIRREFTANVSHELKTPLHTISGCAELMTNGIAKQEDIPKFASQIYSEAQRMIRLVEDIIKLSHLDEGAEDMKRENVDIYSVASETVDNLIPVAEKSDVDITLEGTSAVINGIPQLISAIIFNLCDNAIKYNKKGGKVLVSVKSEDNKAVLTVSDNGIGISEEDSERIFERFYRVDKSHSKEIGGTGLGLSIVKHAARLHNATIDLQSKLNEGTIITVTFPLEN